MSHIEANLFGSLNILYDDLQSGQKTIRSFSSLIGHRGMMKSEVI